MEREAPEKYLRNTINQCRWGRIQETTVGALRLRTQYLNAESVLGKLKQALAHLISYIGLGRKEGRFITRHGPRSERRFPENPGGYR